MRVLDYRNKEDLEILRTQCIDADLTDPVVLHDLLCLSSEMVNIVYDDKHPGVGLAANQVGRTFRAILLAAPDKEPIFMINPQIMDWYGEDEMEESCLSIPGIKVNIKRALKVTVRWRNLLGGCKVQKFSNLSARIIQHEIDHLNGKLIIDYIEDKNGIPAEKLQDKSV